MDRENSVIDFLVFSTFSFSLYSLQSKEANEILDCIIKRAYRDAASHVKSENTNRKKDGISIISDEINSLITGKLEGYDSWHKNLCDRLHNELPCTYGFAQKWVNMTMKYVTLVCDLWDCIGNGAKSKFVNEYGCVVKQYRADFHAPVDRYIINAARKTSKDISLPLIEDAVGNPKEKRTKMDYKNPADHVKSWSSWDEKEYENFHSSLCDYLTTINKKALEWEGPTWIHAAEGQSSPEKKDESTL